MVRNERAQPPKVAAHLAEQTSSHETNNSPIKENRLSRGEWPKEADGVGLWLPWFHLQLLYAGGLLTTMCTDVGAGNRGSDNAKITMP